MRWAACLVALALGGCAVFLDDDDDGDSPNTCAQADDPDGFCDGACNRRTGECLEPGEVVFVDGDSGDDGSSCVAPDDACATVAGGFAIARDRTLQVIHLAPGDYPDTDLTFDNVPTDTELLLLGYGAVLSPAADPIMRMPPSVLLEIHGVTFTRGNGASTPLVVMEPDAVLELYQVTIRDSGNTGIAIDAPFDHTGSITAVASRFINNAGTSIFARDTLVTLRSCLFDGQQSGSAGVEVTTATMENGTFDINLSTFVNHTTFGLRCDVTGNNVRVLGDIVLGNGDLDVSCDGFGFGFERSYVDGLPDVGETNLSAPPQLDDELVPTAMSTALDKIDPDLIDAIDPGETDAGGNPRFAGAAIDIGALERPVDSR